MTILENIHKLESGDVSEKEKEVFNIVLKACKQFPNPVIARVAGGWVRDKAIGKPSDDIDLAIEGTNIQDFGKALLKESGVDEKKEKMAVFNANPEMSKHMDVVRVCIFPKFWIDICSLRPDEIDSTKEGTAESDAKRRDFTINALFFNINTSKVEDFVGGIQDLENKIIRTPVDPKITFGEDPLRVIRGIRFAAKYGFKMDQSTLDSIPLAKEKFENNVTKERVSTELFKAFKSVQSSKIAVDLIFRSTLFTSIFNPGIEFQIDEQITFKRTQTVLSRCDSDEKVFDIILSAIYFDLPALGFITDPLKPKKKIDPIEYIIVRRMKISAKDSDFISHLIKSEKTVESLMNDLSRLSAGHWIREIKNDWKFTRCIIFDDKVLDFFDNVLVKFINDEKMEDLIQMKPLFDGRQLAEKHNVKPGPGLKQYVNQLIDWQIMNPNGKAEDYETYIQSK